MSLSRYLLIVSFLVYSTFSCSKPEPAAESVPNELTDSTFSYQSSSPKTKDTDLAISRKQYADKLYGFWLAQCIANWTGLITEMDKIGGEGKEGKAAGFYTRENWGGPDHPNLWQIESLDEISRNIDFVFKDEDEIWGADDDTDIEYIYQHIMWQTDNGKLTGEQIRNGWLTHIYSDENTPFKDDNGEPQNFLWVSNQSAHDLMLQGKVPPETSDPELNPNYEMIDAQLTTEIFGLFAPGRPDVALDIARLPIQTTARNEAQWIAEFYVIMHSLASVTNEEKSMKEQVFWLAQQAREHLPDTSYSAKMYDFVKTQYDSEVPWEAARDALHEKYQVRQEDGYEWSTKEEACNGCFAAGINFGAGMVSLFYGEGDIKETIKVGALAGWDSDNPTATWGGLLGFMLGKAGVEQAFGRTFSNRFDIHRTRGGFDKPVDNFQKMSQKGVYVVDRVVQGQMNGNVLLEEDSWLIPNAIEILE